MKMLALAFLPAFAFGCLSDGASDCTSVVLNIGVRADLACPTLDEVAGEEHVDEVYGLILRSLRTPARSVCWYRLTPREAVDMHCDHKRSEIVESANADRPPDFVTASSFVTCDEPLSGQVVAPSDACEETSDFVGRDELPEAADCLYDVCTRDAGFLPGESL